MNQENKTFVLAQEHIEKLKKIWASVSVDENTVALPDYQALNSNIGRALVDKLHLLKEGNVLDIGCNSGLYSLLAAPYVKSMIGCDVKKGYIDRAEVAKKYFEQNIYSVSNVRFVNANFTELLTSDIDCVIASKVLYHLGDKNIEILKEFLSSGSKRILIQPRPQRHIKFKSHPEWCTVSVTKLYNGLYKVEDCLELLRDCGFDRAEISSMNICTNKEYFPVIFAAK